MAKLFPRRSKPSLGRRDPRVLDLEDEEADAVFSALSSETARRLYASLQSEPMTPSDLADAIDSSIQNVRYHLGNMEEAGLVEVVDTWYSSRGNEMSVYAATDGPLIVASDRSRAERLKGALGRFVGGVTVLAGLSVLLHYTLLRLYGVDETEEEPPEESENGVGIAQEEPPEEPTTVDAAAETAEAIFSVAPPGVLFFLGGSAVLLVVTGLWYRRAY